MRTDLYALKFTNKSTNMVEKEEKTLAEKIKLYGREDMSVKLSVSVYQRHTNVYAGKYS